MKIFLRNIFIFILFQSSIQTLFSQEPAYRMLDYTSGLASNTVYQIMQDKQGYIWIGHDKGLTRYNGLQMKNYSSNMIQSRGLSNLEEDKFGRIWCQNFSGEMFFTEGDSLREFKKFGSTGNYVPFCIFQKQKVLTARNGSLKIYDILTNKVSNIANPLGVDFVGNISVSEKFIYNYSSQRKAIVEIANLKDYKEIKLSNNIVPSFSIEKNEKLYIIPRYGDGIVAIIDGNKQTQVKLNIKSIIQFVSFINNEIWISTTEGVYVYNQDFEPMRGGQALYSELNVSKVIQDHEGNIWISSLNRGIYIIPNMEVQLIKNQGLSYTTASYFSSIDKIILGTGDNRVFEFNPYNYQTKLLYDFKIRHDILNIYNDVSNDLIWIGSDKMHAIRPSTNSLEFEKVFPLKDIEFLGNSTYALAGSEGVSLFSYNGDTINNLYSSWFLNSSVKWTGNRQLLKGSEGRAKCVAYNQMDNTLYASTYSGFFYWTEGKKGAIMDNGEAIYASKILIKGDKVYIGTYGGSLYILKDRKIFKKVPSFMGLETQTIVTLESTGDNLWLLFENAIVKYNIFTDKYVVIGSLDGIPNVEIKDMVIFNDKVFLASRIGLIEFPENMKNSLVLPKLQIEDIFVNKEKLNGESYEFNLKTDQNNLEINFSLLTYKSSSDINIYYSINGKNWILLGSNLNKLNLVGLSPGNYKVRIKAVKPGGSEIVAPTILSFAIASPIWARWWFILLMVLLLAFLAYSFMRFRLNELRKEAEFKNAKERMEKELQLSILTSIKSQMNPHFIFNALNTVQSYIFTNDKDNAIDYLNKFSDLTRMILDMSNKEMIPLSEEIKALNLYLSLEAIRFEDNFSYRLIVNENVATELIQIPSMLIQPYVENAIKHGLLHKTSERKLRIEFVKENRALVVIIDDNGIGRKKSQEMRLSKPIGHRSFATEANRKRLQLLNHDRENTIDIEFLDKTDVLGNADGTMVILAIPIDF